MILNKDIVHCLMVCIIYNPQSKHCSLTNPTMKKQQHKVHGMEIKLFQAKNAGEQPGKGKSSRSTIVSCKCTYTRDIRIWKAFAWLYYYWLHVMDAILCITLYCLKGEACSLVL